MTVEEEVLMQHDRDIAFSDSRLSVSQWCLGPGVVTCTTADPSMLWWALAMLTVLAMEIGKLYTLFYNGASVILNLTL